MDCNVCKVNFNSCQALENHLLSQDHFSKAQGWTCTLCNTSMTCLDSLRQHLQGGPHKRKIDLVSRQIMPFGNIENSMRSLSLNIVGNALYRCILCDDLAVDEETYRAHVKVKHTTEELVRHFPNEAYISCSLCKMNVSGYPNFKDHLVGKKHMKNIFKLVSQTCTKQMEPQQALRATASTPSFTDALDVMKNCEICKINVSGESNWQAHLAGKKHQRNKSINVSAANQSDPNITQSMGELGVNNHDGGSFSKSLVSEEKSRDQKISVFEFLERSLEKTEENHYPLGRGYCLIINNYDFKDLFQSRKGSDLDKSNLAKTFKELGFEVATKDNLKLMEMENCLDYTVEKLNKDGNDFSSLVVVLMSHGQDDKIITTDGSLFDVMELPAIFSASKCKKMAGKPKIFIINACRGSLPNYSVEADGHSNKGTPNMADYIICYSTTNDSVSFRFPEHGSNFIYHLCEEIKGESKDLYEMMTSINAKLSQIPFPNGAFQLVDIRACTLTKKMLFKK